MSRILFKIYSILMKKFTVRKWVKKKKFKVIQKKMEFDGMQKVSFLSLSEIHLCKKINLRD